MRPRVVPLVDEVARQHLVRVEEDELGRAVALLRGVLSEPSTRRLDVVATPGIR